MNPFRKLRTLFGKEKLDRDMAEEMRFHLAQRTADHVEEGMPPEEARYAARRKFGGVEQIQERCRDQRIRGLAWLEHFGRDLRVSWRVLWKEKAFFAISVFILALGICGVTAQFSVVNSVLIRGLPFPDSDRLVRIALRDPTWPSERSRNPFMADLLDWQRDQQSFERLSGYFFAGSFIVTSGDVPQRFSGSHVTDGFFALLGVAPVQGRDFTADDHRPDAPRVTIISDTLWKSEFGTDPEILGREIRLNGRPATIIGVMPPGFSFPRDQLWMPFFNEYPHGQRPGASPHVLARLKPGVTFDQAAAELTAFARGAAVDFPDTNRDLTEAIVEPLRHNFVGRDARQLLVVMLVAVFAVLLIACANVMNMQLARSAVRAKELAVRGALGASRGRLVAQMLAECLILVTLGGGTGVLLAFGAVDFYAGLMGGLPGGIAVPAWMRVDVNGTVLAFAVAAGGACVLLAGLLPAVLASRANALDVIREGGRGHTSRLVSRATGGLVVGQVALTGGLLIASLLLVKSIANRYALDLGYDMDAVLAGRMNFEADYRSIEEVRDAQRKLLQHLRTSPHFSHVALTTRRSMLINSGGFFEIEGRGDFRAAAWAENISDGYFATLGLRPLAGREFEETDTSDKPPVALVNVSFARKYFPEGSALGRRLRLRPGEPWHTIVGVVPDTLMQGPLESRIDGAGVFGSMGQSPASYATLVVRGRTADPTRLGDQIRREIMRVNPNLAIYQLNTPRHFFRGALAQIRAVTTLFVVFGCVAIVLSAIGLYGVAAFSVSRRTQEFGVRMALGAAPRQIVSLILWQGFKRLVLGSVIALTLALALARLGGSLSAGLLHGVSPYDPLVHAGVVLLLTLATLLACIIPARRATKVDPMAALRAE